MNDRPALELEGVVAGYGDRRILNGVDFAIRPGTITTIIGGNGAGKSTLLKTVYGMTTLFEGAIRLGGRDVTRLSPAKRLDAGMCLVAQGRVNFPGLTVRENLQVAGYRIRRDVLLPRIERVLGMFPVLQRLERSLAGNLSGGEQQLLETGMALLSEPSVLLIDEPSLGLSPKMRDFVFDTMTALRGTGTAVLMVEQNAVQALKIADAGIVLELGRVGAHGSGVSMLEDPVVQKAYLGF